MHNRTLLGNHGEEMVMQFLESQGYRICARNYRISRGEVDIIAERDEVVAFVEVKTRQIASFPISTVITPSKQRRIIIAARTFCALRQIYNRAIRFDVAVVALDHTQAVTYYENAFTDTRNEYF